ncbi:MAG: UDP-N-acetylenolpyruvoylglucosamine reductase [Alphaproteobacteria bacterium]|nr:UDP-N-acetylenolpyruvoylglucosamine reductase [Alphaproteobacteria bacterium]
MMAAARVLPRLIERLPPVRGRLTENASLAGVTWFAVGGPADVLFRPADRDDLAAFLRDKPRDVPVTVIGVGSNLLVRDGGVRGVVVRLGRGFVDISVRDNKVHAGAGALDLSVALTARDHGLAGLEFLSGVPGTIGGALRMNAGAYGGDMARVVVSAEAVDGRGNLLTLSQRELGFTYRHSAVDDDVIFTGATLQATPGDQTVIARRIAEIESERQASQPRSKTGGSTFMNPAGLRAWELIDRAGCRGLTVGAAQVSEKHCNFLINTGDATAYDVEALGEEVRRRVFARTGVALQWEIKRIGDYGPAQKPIVAGAPS